MRAGQGPAAIQYPVLAGLPTRERLAELVPTAFEALLDVLENGTPAERIRAANSILDRGGVPRSSQVETMNRAEGLREAYGPLLELAAKLPPRELVRRQLDLCLPELGDDLLYRVPLPGHFSPFPSLPESLKS